jgi:hypothetical protein
MLSTLLDDDALTVDAAMELLASELRLTFEMPPADPRPAPIMLMGCMARTLPAGNWTGALREPLDNPSMARTRSEALSPRRSRIANAEMAGSYMGEIGMHGGLGEYAAVLPNVIANPEGCCRP